jgi:hypothetical protein
MMGLQPYLAIGLRSIGVLASRAVGLTQTSGIRKDMRDIRAGLRGTFSTIGDDIREILSDLCTLASRIVEIDNRLDERLEHS